MKAVLIALVSLMLVVTAGTQLYPECATDLAITTKRSIAGLERQQVSLPDGSEYIYLDSNPGNADNLPVMVLLHGFGADKDNFTEVAPFLVDDYRIIAPDHQGFAESSKDMNGDYSPLAQVTRLSQLFEQLGLQQFVLGGSSMGGLIAMTYASEHPEDVQALWLLDPAGVQAAPISEARQVIKEQGTNPLVAHTVEEFHAVFDLVMSEPPFIPDFVLDTKAQARINNVELEKRIFKQFHHIDIVPQVTGLDIPALIVWGSEDRVLHPDGADLLAAALPNNQVIKMPGIGHLPMLEAPKQSAADLLAFLASAD